VFEAPEITTKNKMIANNAKTFDNRHNHRMPLKRRFQVSGSRNLGVLTASSVAPGFGIISPHATGK